VRKHHNLKIHPDFFNAVESGAKTFELRKNDRDFAVHDTLELREWNPRSDGYTGRVIKGLHITYVLQGGDLNSIGGIGISPGWAILGIKRDK
jgi:hypothetical protein